ncbi:biopolymer transporter ExbD [Treponema sp. C6A8]|uniref:ExbD/TolR family protein n=1 Tax=Treponema sp. C6A8 TaxID=1410609 RepID=UPI000480AA47|nr:biopolymer transporter ExbD [Treponema sp. C6A8]
MRLSKNRKRITSNVDMTPMIDIVFQLILFFLVSTTFAILPGIKLNLPESTTAEGTSMKGITITAEANGSLYFNEKEVNMKTLKAELVKYDTGDTKKIEFPISLEADSEVKNGTIVKLFDVIRESGYAVINLRTTSKK